VNDPDDEKWERALNRLAASLVLPPESAMHHPGGRTFDPLLSEGDLDGGPKMGAALAMTQEDQADAELVDRVLRGEQAGYRILVERYQGKIFAVAFGILRNREDARDVTQEAFVKAYRNLPAFRRDSSFYTWLYRIAFNLAVDSKRKVYRVRETAISEDEHEIPDEALNTGPAPVGNPDRHFQSQEIRDKVKFAISQLPTDQRTAIVLREVEGLSYKEIAESMGCAEGTVMSRLFYARKKLQEMLKDLR
jgi:RNA polymerase sigma-70 factor (ECF subfamily)